METPKQIPIQNQNFNSDTEAKQCNVVVDKISKICYESDDKKEDLCYKLSDSACGSLNESDDSGSKGVENESNLGDAQDESDSLECDENEEGDLAESEEEESVDNNTFNVINTENSESQEISELTNDDSSNCDKIKENEMQTAITGQTSENSLGLETTEDSPNSVDLTNEYSEESVEITQDKEDIDYDYSIEEEEESSKSKRSEDQTETSDDPAMEVSTDSNDKTLSKPDESSNNTSPKEDPKMQAQLDKSTKNSTNPSIKKDDCKQSKVNSQKLRKNFGPFSNLPKNNDFKIEIFESKRKLETSDKQDDNLTKPVDKVDDNSTKHVDKHELENRTNDQINTNAKNLTPYENEAEKSLLSPQNSEKPPSSEPSISTSTSDMISPDSVDKTSSIMLDVSQVIKEESEDSDALSPLRSLVEDAQDSSPHGSGETTTDTSRKGQSQGPKILDSEHSPVNSKTKPLVTSPQSAPVSPPNPSVKSPSPTVKEPVHKSTENAEHVTSQSSTPSELKKPTPMAFTVDLDSAASDSSTSGNSGKKLDIGASISQWAPKHRRNLSLTKVEEHKKVEERQGCEKPPAGRPRSGTVGAPQCPSGPKKGGYHSEGYFSSDQDEEATKRTDLKSPRSPAAPDTTPSPRVLVRSNSEDSSKGTTTRMRPPSPLSPTSPYGTPLNETASFLIEKMMSGTPETKRKHAPKAEGRSCCKERERKPSVSELTGKSYKTDKKMGSDGKKQVKNTPAEDLDPSKDDKDDDVSEAGTYTIDKDATSLEEDQARQDIDGVFGVTTESEVEEVEGASTITTTAVPMSTTDQGQEDESSWLSASEMQPTISRNSPNWIQQWAAHVAEQTKPTLEPLSPIMKPLVPSQRGHKLPLTSQDSNDPRPRRKLPTPPSHLNAPSSGISQRSDPVGSGKHRQLWHEAMPNSQTNSNTEAFLRETEDLVTSLQARVDKTKAGNPAFRNTSFESHESGGDSDFDTSASYPFNEDERMTATLKSKLRLTGLMPSSKSMSNSPSAAIASPRRPDGGTVKDPKLKRVDRGVRDPGYDLYSPRRDDRGIQSDSSSETSDPYKDVTRASDSAPPLKFNRAFSLRRARLGCDEPVSTQSVEKKKITRPSSAGAVGSGRKTLLGSSKPYQSADNSSVSSPRGYGFGSTKGLAPPAQTVGSRATLPSDNFDRTDGGRFSLRMPRPGPPSIGIVKSPSKSSLKKEPGNKKNPARSSSTLSSKEVDFQNWKRRKNYDPMKAAAEGRKKQVEQKMKSVPPTSQANSEHQSPSPPGSLLRSASFHGTEGVLCNVRWTRKGAQSQPHYTSEDDGPYSLEEEAGPHPSPRHGSPLHRSPTSPHQLCQSPARQPPPTSRGRRPSLGLSEEGDVAYQPSLRKISMDESGSEGKRSPLNGGVRGGVGNAASGGGPGRPKTKMEALDNLVISTIHSLSVKVRTTSESLLQKLKSQYDEEGDRAALLEEVLSHLSESDQSLASGQTRSTSRELAGILRNLKKIEHALEVIDRVIIVGEEDYRDEDDIDYVPTEWVEESDY